MIFRANLGGVDISATRRDSDEYRCSNVNPEPASAFDVDFLFDQEFLGALAVDVVELSEERVSATSNVLKEISFIMPVSGTGYVHLVQQLAGEVKNACRRCEVDRRELPERDGKMEELSLKA